MGCFNKACGLTQMPIGYNDETVTFVIIKKEKWGANRLVCYIDDLWTMIPIPIYGKYNDYGGQEDHAGQEQKYAALRECFPDVADLEPDECKKLTSPFENNEALNDSTHCGKFAIKHRFSATTEVVKTIMFSRPAYDKFVANQISYDGEITPIDNLVKGLETFDELSKPIIQAALDKFVTDNNIEKEVTFDTFLTFHPISHIGYAVIDMLEDKWSNPVAGIIDFYSADSVTPKRRSLVSSGAVTHKELTEAYLLHLSMSALGKIIQPQMTTGQDRVYPHHAILVEAMNDTLLRIKAEEEEEEED